MRDYREIIRSEYEARRNSNGRYSARAFARFLGINHATLHLVLSKKSDLGDSNLKKVADRLKWSDAIRVEAWQEIRTRRAKVPIKRQKVSKPNPKFLRAWYLKAVRNLCFYFDVPNDVRWVAARMGISLVEARRTLSVLLRSRICRVDSGFVRVQGGIAPELLDDREMQVRKYVRACLQQGVEAVDTYRGANRATYLSYVPLNAQGVKEMHQLLYRFGQRIGRQSERKWNDKGSRELYALQLQVFPVKWARAR